MRRNCWDKISFEPAGATERKGREGPDNYCEKNRSVSPRITKLEKIPQTTTTALEILENSFPLKISIRKISELNPIQSYAMRERERGREERARSLQIIKIIKEACPQKGKKCNFIFRSDGNEMNKMIEDKKITN